MASLRKYSPLVNRKETEAEPEGIFKKKNRSTEIRQLAAGGNAGGTDTDCRIVSWFWQLFALAKGDRPLFVTYNPCMPVANTMG